MKKKEKEKQHNSGGSKNTTQMLRLGQIVMH